jgi:hypothetical protein
MNCDSSLEFLVSEMSEREPWRIKEMDKKIMELLDISSNSDTFKKLTGMFCETLWVETADSSEESQQPH